MCVQCHRVLNTVTHDAQARPPAPSDRPAPPLKSNPSSRGFQATSVQSWGALQLRPSRTASAQLVIRNTSQLGKRHPQANTGQILNHPSPGQRRLRPLRRLVHERLKHCRKPSWSHPSASPSRLGDITSSPIAPLSVLALRWQARRALAMPPVLALGVLSAERRCVSGVRRRIWSLPPRFALGVWSAGSVRHAHRKKCGRQELLVLARPEEDDCAAVHSAICSSAMLAKIAELVCMANSASAPWVRLPSLDYRRCRTTGCLLFAASYSPPSTGRLHTSRRLPLAAHY